MCGAETVFGQENNDDLSCGHGDDMIRRSVLEDESNGFKIDDRVIIRATITTHGHLASTVAAGPGAAVFNPPETLRTDMRALLKTGRASDIALYCGPREFAAHRTILRARSSYFEALFASSMKDADRWDRCAIVLLLASLG